MRGSDIATVDMEEITLEGIDSEYHIAVDWIESAFGDIEAELEVFSPRRLVNWLSRLR